MCRAVAAGSVKGRPSDLLKVNGPHQTRVHESFTPSASATRWILKVKRTKEKPAVQAAPKLRRAISRELHYDQKLRGLALHQLTGLSSTAHTQHNRTAAFISVAQGTRCKEVEAEERALAEADIEYPDLLEPLAVKRQRVKMEEALQAHLHKVGPAQATAAAWSDESYPYSDIRYDPTMDLDSTALV